MIKIYIHKIHNTLIKVVSQTSSVDVKCCKKYILKFASGFMINVRKGHTKWHCDCNFLKKFINL